MNGMKRKSQSPKSQYQQMTLGIRFLSFVVCGFFVAACMPSGIANISIDGQRFAVVNGNDLYVYASDNPEIVFYNFFPDLRYTPALSADGSALVYVDRGGRLMYQVLNGGERPRQLLPNPINQQGLGVFTFLPDGNLLMFNASSSFDHDLRIFEPTSGQTMQWITGISQVFVSGNIIQQRQAPTAANEFGVGHVNASVVDSLQIVLIPNNCLTEDERCFYSYTIDANGFHDNGPLLRQYTDELQILLTRRVDDDLTSGIVTPDGKHLILRMRSFANPSESQSIYLMDLNTNDPMIPIIENGPAHPDYALSPDGQFIAYEETINGVAFVQILNIATGDRTDLGPGTLDPQWWQ
jgi:hypothetical protein